MSAVPVSDKDIDCLAYWIWHLGLSKRSAESIGKELRAENYKSLRARYWGQYEKAPTYHWTLPKANESKGYDPFSPDQALKTVHFYDYQSCEHYGQWEKSQSYRWIKRLEATLTKQGADWEREGLTWGVYA